MSKPKCWESICYAAGTGRGGAAPVMLMQADCKALVAWVAYLCDSPVTQAPSVITVEEFRRWWSAVGIEPEDR